MQKIHSWKKTFSTIWAGQAVSLVTSAIVQYALIWDLTARTQSAAVLSIASMVGLLPMALFSPFIGSLVDRWKRKTIMLVADAGIGLVTLALALLAFVDILPVGAVLAALFLRAVGTAFHQPCLQAVTPQIVPIEQLTRCNGYTASIQSISYIASPALAAALYAALPLGPILLLDTVGAAAGIATVAVVRLPRVVSAAGAKVRILRDALDGLKLLRKERGLFLLVLICSLFSLAYVPVSSLYPLMCMAYFGGTAQHAGIAEMVFAGGMLLGGLVLGVWGGTKNRLIIMVGALLLLGTSTVVSGLLPPSAFAIFVVMTFLTGFSGPFFNSPFMAMLQEKIPPDYLGRILGVSSSMMALATPLGLGLSGLFADSVGIENWFVISGAVCLLCAVPCVVVRAVREADMPKD